MLMPVACGANLSDQENPGNPVPSAESGVFCVCGRYRVLSLTHQSQAGTEEKGAGEGR